MKLSNPCATPCRQMPAGLTRIPRLPTFFSPPARTAVLKNGASRRTCRRCSAPNKRLSPSTLQRRGTTRLPNLLESFILIIIGATPEKVGIMDNTMAETRQSEETADGNNEALMPESLSPEQIEDLKVRAAKA